MLLILCLHLLWFLNCRLGLMWDRCSCSCGRRTSRCLVFVMHLIPLVQCLLSRLILCVRGGLLLLILLLSCVLQNCTLNVHFVHEIESVARSLKFVIEADCIFISNKLLKLTHTSFLCGLRWASEEPWFLLEDRKVLDLKIALLRACCRA